MYSVQSVAQLPVLYCMTLNTGINNFEQTPAARAAIVQHHHFHHLSNAMPRTVALDWLFHLIFLPIENFFCTERESRCFLPGLAFFLSSSLSRCCIPSRLDHQHLSTRISTSYVCIQALPSLLALFSSDLIFNSSQFAHRHPSIDDAFQEKEADGHAVAQRPCTTTHQGRIPAANQERRP